MVDRPAPRAQWKNRIQLRAYTASTPERRAAIFVARLCELSSRRPGPESKIHHLQGLSVNNCPNCKKVIAELKMSTIKAKLESLPAFDCVTLCCPSCGVIVLAVPDLGSVANDVKTGSSGH